MATQQDHRDLIDGRPVVPNIEQRVAHTRAQASVTRPTLEADQAHHSEVRAERAELAERLGEMLDLPLTLLAFVVLALLVAEYAGWIPDRLLVWADRINTAIWAVFTVEFLARLLITPTKLDFLRRNWLAALSVILPAFRVLRVFRAVRVLRSVRLLRLLTTLNRSLRETSASLGGRTFPFFVAATLIVILVGAAGILTVEQEANTPSVTNFGDALWWAVTLVAASELGERPVTVEGRLVALGLAIYGMAVFGYITATLASTFIGSKARADAAAAQDRAVQLERRLDALHSELAALRRDLKPPNSSPGERA